MKMQNMKSTSKKLIGSLLVISTMMFSFNASAQQPSVENSVTTFVVEQSQQLIKEMAVQLKQSINDEIKSFSVADSLIWGSEELTQVAIKAQSDKENENRKPANKKPSNKLNKKSAE